MSYRSITAATPIRNSPSSPRRSTRTTLPNARTNTSVLCVISAGNVRVMSRSEPASKSWSITKYSPRVEMSRVLPFWFPFGRSVGILTITGKDKSYRRALRRSDIKLIPHPIRGQDFLAGPLLSFRHYYLKSETCGSSPDEPFDPESVCEYVVIWIKYPANNTVQHLSHKASFPTL